MIELTRINGTKLMLNPDIIETMEETPDTVITLNNGHKYIVSESAKQVCQYIISFKREIYRNLLNINQN